MLHVYNVQSNRDDGLGIKRPKRPLSLPPGQVLVIDTKLVAQQHNVSSSRADVPMRVSEDPGYLGAATDQAGLSYVLESIAAEALTDSVVLILRMRY